MVLADVFNSNRLVVAAPATEKVAPENIQRRGLGLVLVPPRDRRECSSFKAQTELVGSTYFY